MKRYLVISKKANAVIIKTDSLKTAKQIIEAFKRVEQLKLYDTLENRFLRCFVI